MWNKFSLKLGITFLLLSIFNALILSYWSFKCWQTDEVAEIKKYFYCTGRPFGDFGGPVLLVSALILLVLSIISLLTSRFYKGRTFSLLQIIFLIFGVTVFLAAYVVFFQNLKIATFSKYQASQEKFILETNQRKCDQYNLLMSQWKEGEGIPVPPREKCN